ncbi:cytochrome P450 [Ktedonobacter racemifer]|uniref:Cytochrome P450 n=1 Tax=Ktedonobacter racemifer DSM 44963 TaxID=485913 RepID=D6U615_KTERA|nr:cytochrome P450 [Ktedonobacter racemifer]EFH80426.1 cytochrome P450 [Ktedonobacter racemifer DSM 44963]
MSNEQDINVQVQDVQQEAPLHFPFPLADHRLELPKEYTELQAKCPVARVKMPYGGDALLLTRHADITKAANDAQRCGTILRSDGDVPRMEVSSRTREGSLFTVTPERHNQIRRLVTQAFTVKHANEMRPGVVTLTNRLIDEMERKGPPADLYEDYAIKTPMAVICELLGIPYEDERLFREWGRDLLSRTATSEEQQERWQKMVQYITPLIEKERANPSNTVLGLLVKNHEQGDGVLTEQEMLSFALGLIAAGFETTSTSFTNSAFVLFQRPDLLEQLKARVDDAEAMASAIEEILRVTLLGAGGRPRIAREEVEFSGVHVPPGEVLVLPFHVGNRDPSVFSDPDVVNFDRTPNPILSFGRGIHACLGQQLARMEMQVLWMTLLKRLPNVRLAVAPSEVPWRSGDTATTGPAHLPVVW